MSAAIGAGRDAVVDGLRSFAEARGGSIAQSARALDEPNTLALSADGGNCVALYPWEFLEWEEASEHLSIHLNGPVFFFHIHDGDFWVLVLFDKGRRVTQFNPIPAYWDDNISAKERASWAGDADAIAACVPGISAEAIRPYFCEWHLPAHNREGRAFPDDQFEFNDCDQLRDFLRRIGVQYPLNENFDPLGETFEFIAPDSRERR